MFQKLMTAGLIGAALVMAACNTVRGAARDVNSVANCTEKLLSHVRSVPTTEGAIMVQKLVAVALIGACLGIAACNTVRGAATDVSSVANCTENTINTGHCK